MTKKFAQILVPIAAIVALLPITSPAIALVMGVAIALSLENPYPTQKYIHILLTWSVVGLGAGMNFNTVAQAGFSGIGYTIVSIALVWAVGLLLIRLLKVDEEVGLLITMGTAICGGSAIAALTPVLRAKPQSVSVALGTVFILNAIALTLFPFIGWHLHLSERAFGLWSALAIHDTSSVVGATLSYGPLANEVGTTVKLARALWIVPIVIAFSFFKNSKSTQQSTTIKARKPWFIAGFLIAAALVTWVPVLQPTGHFVEMIAKRTLVLTLFLIGLGLSKKNLRQVGPRPFILGVTLWVLTAFATLSAIEMGLIQ